MDQPNEYVLTLHCPDRPGLVFAVSQWLMEHGCNIVASDQFGDPRSGRFFLRLRFVGEPPLAALRTSFEPVAQDCSMTWGLWRAEARPKVLVLVSKYEHCLADLLHRARVGDLPIEIVLVVSNHPDAGYLATAFEVDFVVLARYMQILTAETCAALSGQIINIHHSYLPSFKGAKPYFAAHARGVKIIGATAHYVTPDLDEGPIIEQDTERVDHRQTPQELEAAGRNIETQVLARAVRYQAEHRILLNGARTVVFR